MKLNQSRPPKNNWRKKAITQYEQLQIDQRRNMQLILAWKAPSQNLSKEVL